MYFSLVLICCHCKSGWLRHGTGVFQLWHPNHEALYLLRRASLVLPFISTSRQILFFILPHFGVGLSPLLFIFYHFYLTPVYFQYCFHLVFLYILSCFGSCSQPCSGCKSFFGGGEHKQVNKQIWWHGIMM